MEKLALEKSVDAFRTISEVADHLDLPQHVLRFWETRFPQIRPLKRAGGRRFYRPTDVDLLRGIRDLLYGEGYTIKGVQRLLRERGARGLGGDATAADRIAEAGGAASFVDADGDVAALAVEAPVTTSDDSGSAGPSTVGAEGGAGSSEYAPTAGPRDDGCTPLRRTLAIIEDCERRLRAALSPVG